MCMADVQMQAFSCGTLSWFCHYRILLLPRLLFYMTHMWVPFVDGKQMFSDLLNVGSIVLSQHAYALLLPYVLIAPSDYLSFSSMSQEQSQIPGSTRQAFWMVLLKSQLLSKEREMEDSPAAFSLSNPPHQFFTFVVGDELRILKPFWNNLYKF